MTNTAWNILNFRSGLIKTLLAHNHQVIAIAPADEYIEDIEALGCQVIPIKQLSRKGTNPMSDLRLVHELYRIYSRENIDIALHYTIKPNIYGSLAARLSGTRSICTVTGLGYSFMQKGWVNRLVRSLYKRAFRRVEVVAFQNEDDRELFVKGGLVAPQKTLLIKGSGIRCHYFVPLPKTQEQDKMVFLFVGRLLFDKGIREFLEAAKQLQSQKAEFWVLGTIDEGNPSCISPRLIHEVHEAGIVHYLGSSDDVREIMRNADIVVLPSYREGLPRVMLEALSMAKPVITTQAPGCRETVVDGVNGLMIPVADASALADAMLKMLSLTPDTLIEMGKAGRTMALEQFDETIIVGQYLELIAGNKDSE